MIRNKDFEKVKEKLSKFEGFITLTGRLRPHKEKRKSVLFPKVRRIKKRKNEIKDKKSKDKDKG